MWLREQNLTVTASEPHHCPGRDLEDRRGRQYVDFPEDQSALSVW